MPETRDPNAPYCSNCGYNLTGCIDSAKCPECGRPLVEVLSRRPAYLERGKRFRSTATLFGLPVIDIAIGPKGGELRGKAKGIMALGDIATGWLAIGGIARGIVAIGGMALGLFSIGGMSIGLITALGGGALGGIAVGGGAVGGIAAGGGACGYIAQGGGAAGYFARGGDAWGTHIISMQRGIDSPDATALFKELSWLLGSWPPNAYSMLNVIAIVGAVTVGVAVLITLIAMAASRSEGDSL